MHVKNIENVQFNYQAFENLIQQKIIKQHNIVQSYAKCNFNHIYLYIYIYLYMYYLRGFSCLRYSFFQFKSAPTSLYLSRDKIKGQSDKNTILTLTKTLPKKQGHFPIDFQISLSTYKLDSQNKNYIYIYTDNY